MPWYTNKYGGRFFVEDESGADSKIQQSAHNLARKLKKKDPNVKYYVASEKSPNMGTRVFMDVEGSRESKVEAYRHFEKVGRGLSKNRKFNVYQSSIDSPNIGQRMYVDIEKNKYSSKQIADVAMSMHKEKVSPEAITSTVNKMTRDWKPSDQPSSKDKAKKRKPFRSSPSGRQYYL